MGVKIIILCLFIHFIVIYLFFVLRNIIVNDDCFQIFKYMYYVQLLICGYSE